MGRPPEPLRFVADEMLGRLATWLRLLGQDVEYEAPVEDSWLLRRCLDDPGRILLTRDTRLMETRPVARGQVAAMLIGSDHLGDQLRQVAQSREIKALPARCGVCNSELISRDKAEVEGEVPAYVFRTQEVFRQCARCGRIYWRATQWDRIQRVRSSVFGE
jgi:uncharacterized protein with PIN domain